MFRQPGLSVRYTKRLAITETIISSEIVLFVVHRFIHHRKNPGARWLYTVNPRPKRQPCLGHIDTQVLYLVPSLLFNLAIYCIPKLTINKLNATSFWKCWLTIPGYATLAPLFHPEVTNVFYLLHIHEKT